MTFRSRLIASLGGLILLPATAQAQTEPGVHVDPSGSSPPGVVYQLPLDSARGDAAPHGHSGSHGGGSGSGSGSGSGHSGSGSGASGAGTGGTGGSGGAGGAGGTGGGGASGSGSGSSGSGAGGGGGQGGGVSLANSSIHSENGLGSSSQVPGVSGSGTVSSERSSSSGAGIAAPLGLLVAVVLLAGTAAVAGRRVARQRQA
jgi:hypothetical protein